MRSCHPLIFLIDPKIAESSSVYLEARYYSICIAFHVSLQNYMAHIAAYMP